MFFPDKARACSEVRRLLRRGGVLLFNVWHRIEENEYANTVTTALAGLFLADPSLFMVRTPQGYFDREATSRDLATAGFSAAPRFESIAAHSRAVSARVPAIALQKNQAGAGDHGQHLHVTINLIRCLSKRVRSSLV